MILQGLLGLGLDVLRRGELRSVAGGLGLLAVLLLAFLGDVLLGERNRVCEVLQQLDERKTLINWEHSHGGREEEMLIYDQSPE